MSIFRKKSSAEITDTYDGSHVDHWCSVFGFGDQDHMESQVRSLADGLNYDKKIDKNTHIYRNKFGMASSIGIQSDDTIITLFPAISTSKPIPVHIKSILEWAHSDRKEAQVLGSGRDEFYLDFFVVDYCENKKKYHQNDVINIALAGFAYVIDSYEPDNEGDDGSKILHPELCTYLPSPERGQISEFDFIGKVLSSGSIKFMHEELLIFDVKLINNEENPHFFSLPIAVNPKNMRVKDVSVGDMITGCFWLQGRAFG